MSQLLVIKGPNLGVSYVLGERTRIGRLGENEIQVPDPNVSRTHAEVVQDGEEFVIYDRGSKNGVLINGNEVAEKRLVKNDEVTIGGSTFIFNGDFAIHNSRFTDNSVYIYKGTPKKSLFDDAITIDALKESPSDSGFALVNLARAFAEEPATLPSLAERICDVTQKHFAADHVVLFLQDHPTSEMRPFVAVPQNESVYLGNGLITSALDSRKAISVVDTVPSPPGLDMEPAAGSDMAGASHRPKKSTTGASEQAIMCAPLLTGADASGMLVVSRHGSEAYSKEDLALLQAIASIARLSLHSVREIERATRAAAQAQAPMDAEQRTASTRSLRIQEIYNSAKRSADGEGTVLITGERGTGKETLARYIHESGSRASGPFVCFNCSGIPPEQFEREFFGYEKQAFEGAVSTTAGKVEEAQGGTLFLDDIGELDLSLQPLLLRFLQDRAFYRQGANRPIEADIRVIAATNADLAAAVRAGKFREDLWYRLNVVPFHMPPLRERREDIGPLLDFFISRHATALNRKVLGANDSTVSLLQKYDWPGNIRELSNAVERAVLLAEGKVLATSDFSHIEEARRRLNSQADLERKRDTKPLAEVERQHIIIALKKHNFNQARAAEALGLHRNTLRNKIIEYGIEISK